MSRRETAWLLLALLAAFLIWDAVRLGLPDPFRAPAPLALASGAPASGAHCTQR